MPGMAPFANGNSRLKCNEISDEAHRSLFDAYYDVNEDRKNAYIFGCIVSTKPKTLHTSAKSHRMFSAAYYVTIGGKRRRVCKMLSANFMTYRKAKYDIWVTRLLLASIFLTCQCVGSICHVHTNYQMMLKGHSVSTQPEVETRPSQNFLTKLPHVLDKSLASMQNFSLLLCILASYCRKLRQVRNCRELHVHSLHLLQYLFLAL